MPQFQQYIIKSKRVDAKVALTSLVQLQESFYTNKGNTYTADLENDLACKHKGVCSIPTPGGDVLSLDEHYKLTVESVSGGADPDAAALLAGFTIRATATGAQKKDDEKECASLALNSRNQKSAVNGAGEDTDDCW
ncbi:type IV pilin protein [Candidatus Venteria ishoeyi]|nr:type IV pilin protein [Candidatus Venteria ishoeyi]